jgi:hypothetical protein
MRECEGKKKATKSTESTKVFVPFVPFVAIPPCLPEQREES